MTSSRFLPVLLLAACAETLAPLPPQPTASRPEVKSFSPARGVAGTRVTVLGAHFGKAPKVRFGDRGESVPERLSDDGTSLDVRVPEDAAAGVISVLVDGVEARSEASFAFLGGDRLQNNRVWRTVDLRIPYRHVVPVADYGGLALFSGQPYDVVSFESDGAPELPLTNIVDIEAADEGRRLFVLSTFESESVCSGALGFLAFLHIPNDAAHPARRVCLRESDGDGTREPVAFATDPSGDHIVVIGSGGGWLVDVSRTPADVKRLTLADTLLDWRTVRWIGGTRFAIGIDTTLYAVDWLQTPAMLPQTVELTAGLNSGANQMTYRDADHTLVVANGGVAEVFDTTSWPATPRAVAETHAVEPITGLALSRSGDRLAVTQHDLDRVVTFDLTKTPPEALAAASVPGVARIEALADGTFVAAGLGGYTLVAPATGSVFGQRVLNAGFDWPVRRKLQLPGEKPADVLEFASSQQDRIVRLNSDLQLVAPTGIAPPLDRDPLDEIAGTAASPTLVVRRGDTLYRTLPDDGNVEGDDAWNDTLGRVITTSLRLSDDAAALSFLVSAVGEKARHAVVLPMNRTWADFAARTFELPDEDVTGVECGLTACVLSGDKSLRFLDRAAALAGEESVLGDVHFQGGIDFALLHPKGVLVISGDELHLVTPDAKSTFVGAWPALEDLSAVAYPRLSPGARRLYWLDSGELDTRLRALRLDPETLEVLGEDPAVLLPGDPRSFELDPTGQLIYVLDDFTDRLLVVD